jgi:phenylacetate-coenzyme A ligase PaaK-like adenylate-forming protein
MDRITTTRLDLEQELVRTLAALAEWRRRRAVAGDRLAAFLAHVTARVPFYRDTAARLDDFPPVTRELLARRRREFLAEGGAGELPHFARTSGSTGEPLTVEFDRAAWYDFNHDTYTRIARLVPGLAERMTPGRTGVVLVTNELSRVERTVVLVGLRGALLRCVVVGRDEAADRQLIGWLRSEPPPLLYGKSSYLRDLAAADARSPGGRIRAGAILTSGENLFPDVRAALECWFGCAVHDAYISCEGGLIAAECGERCGLHVEEERVHLEVATEQGVRPEGRGELLLTNPSNWRMAFVRYRIGDTGVLSVRRCGCGRQGPLLEVLAGREATSFDTAAGPIAPATLDPVFQALGAADYQVEEIGQRAYRVRWVAGAAASPELDRLLAARLADRLPGCALTVAPAASLLKRGGKLRRYVARAAPPAPVQFAAPRAPRTLAEKVRVGAICGRGRYVAAACAGGIEIHALHRCSREYRPLPGVSGPLALVGPGAVVAAASERGEVSLLRGGAPACPIGTPGALVTALVASADEVLLAWSRADRTVELWDLAASEPAGALAVAGCAGSLAFTPEGSMLGIGLAEAVELWDLPSWQPVLRLPVGPGAARSLAFSPGAKWLACGGDDGELGLWHVGSGDAGPALRGGEGGAVAALAFSHDGRFVAAGRVGGVVQIRDLTGDTVAADLSFDAPVTHLAFAPEGQLVVLLEAGGRLAVATVARSDR